MECYFIQILFAAYLMIYLGYKHALAACAQQCMAKRF